MTETQRVLEEAGLRHLVEELREMSIDGLKKLQLHVRLGERMGRWLAGRPTLC